MPATTSAVPSRGDEIIDFEVAALVGDVNHGAFHITLGEEVKESPGFFPKLLESLFLGMVFRLHVLDQ